MTEIELIEKTALRVGMKSLMNHGAASCVYTEGCNGVSQAHLIAFAREVALHCVAALQPSASAEPVPLLMQDENSGRDGRRYNEWHASRPDARLNAREAATAIGAAREQEASATGAEPVADHYKVLFNFSKLGHEQAFAKCQDLSALLRRSLQQLARWQEKYGEHQPAWLPPAGDVRLAEDIDAALATPTSAPVQEKP